MATLKVDGKVYENVKKIKAKTDTETTVDFVDTSDATATASDITSGKTAYVNGEIVVGSGVGFEGDTVANAIIDGSITEITSNVETISAYSFYKRDKLTTVSFPNAINVKDYAFADCTALENAKLSNVEQAGNHTFQNTKFVDYEICLPKLKTAGKYTFQDAFLYFKDLNLPNLETVGAYAFQNCKAQNYFLPKLKNVPNYCFSGIGPRAGRGSTLDLPVCESIGDYAFYYARLYKISAPNCKSIGNRTFNNCFDLYILELPKIEAIGDYTFNSSMNITILDFPKLKTIGIQGLYYQKKLLTINIPLVETLEVRALASCEKLETIDLPMAINLGSYVFSDCKSLININIPKITAISNNCFSGCVALENLDLNLVTSISSSAFSNCTVLTKLIIRTPQVCTLGNTNAFTSTPIASGTGYVYVPDELVEQYKASTNWVTYANQIKGISELPTE